MARSRFEDVPPFASGVTRRQFLAATAAALPLLSSGCRKLYEPGAFHVPAISPVAMFAADDYRVDFERIVGRGLRELGVDVRGRRVLLKPNMVEYEANTAINTHAMVVAGAALAFRSAGAAEVVVGEGPGHRRDIEYLLTRSGLYEQLREQRVRFVDLNHDDVAYVRMRSRFTGLDGVVLPVELLKSDFIVSMPKLKTHHWTGMTASLKNFFGALPGAVYGWPKNILHVKGIERSIVDLNSTIQAHLTIVDAVTAMEGDGPIMGKPRHVGFVGMSPDLVAMDATLARIIGLDPVKMPYIEASSRFLGNIDERKIEHRGEAMSRYATHFEVLDEFKPIQLPRT